MRIVYDMIEQTYRRINELVQKGHYPTLQDFLDISIANQLYLEEQALDQLPLGKRLAGRTAKEQIETTKDFKELGRNWGNLLIVETVPVTALLNQQMPFSNRIFPAKVAIRVLCNTLGESRAVDYGIYSDVVSQVAVKLGTYLGTLDKKQGRSFRLQALSIGLPAAKRGDQKIAIRRFLEHVVGGSRHPGEYYGMLLTLGLAGMPTDGQLGVTDDGLHFAELENPILDGPPSAYGELNSCLSKKEAEFYLELVKKRLPQEAQTMEIIREIARTNHSYPEICAEYTKRLGSDAGQVNISQAVSTELARLRELGVVSVRAQGLKTYYDVPTQ